MQAYPFTENKTLLCHTWNKNLAELVNIRIVPTLNQGKNCQGSVLCSRKLELRSINRVTTILFGLLNAYR